MRQLLPWRSLIKQFCDLTGANRALVRIHRGDMVVLCYHGVLAEARPDRWSYENWVDANSFRAQLRWIKEVLEPCGLDGLRRWRNGNWGHRKSPVLITFDDGYRNNLLHAAPILRQEGVPAVFFLAAGYVGTPRVLWNEEIRMRVLHWPRPEIRLPSGEVAGFPSDFRARRDLSDRTNRACKQLSEAQRLEYMDYLRSATSALDVMDDREARGFMSWDEARELSNLGFEIGSHTVEHPILGRVERSRLVAELRDSKAMIERQLGRSCEALAYPNGSARDVNQAVIEEVRNAGYDWAFMTTPVWHKRGGDPLRIARVGFPGHTDMATFKFYASGLHTLLQGTS